MTPAPTLLHLLSVVWWDVGHPLVYPRLLFSYRHGGVHVRTGTVTSNRYMEIWHRRRPRRAYIFAVSLCVIHLGPSVEQGVQRCWPRAPAKARGVYLVGMEVCIVLAGSRDTTYLQDVHMALPCSRMVGLCQSVTLQVPPFFGAELCNVEGEMIIKGRGACDTKVYRYMANRKRWVCQRS